jgi:hypothetical protein
MLVHDDAPEDPREIFVPVVLVAQAGNLAQRAASDTVELTVRDAVGMHELAEPDEELGCERLVAADAFRVSDEAKQPLRIATREDRHGLPKIRRMTNGRER